MHHPRDSDVPLTNFTLHHVLRLEVTDKLATETIKRQYDGW
jgi:hypothetical protein